jgi:hypothetical protein
LRAFSCQIAAKILLPDSLMTEEEELAEKDVLEEEEEVVS